MKNLFLILILIQFNNKLLSQNQIDCFAINPKIGPAFSVDGGEEQPVIGLGINVLKNKFLYSLDYLGHDKLGALILNHPSQNQLGLLMGKYHGERYFRFQYQAGLNIFWGEFPNPGSSNPWIGGGSSGSSFFTVGAVTKLDLNIFL